MQLSPDFENNEPLASSLIDSMLVVEDFLSEVEEQNILDEVEPYMRRLHYEFDHWDDVGIWGVARERLVTLVFRQYTVTEKRNV